VSTITKLDKTVRLDRYLRKEKTRQLQSDLVQLDSLLRRGYAKLNQIAETEYRTGLNVSDTVKAPIKEQIDNLFRARVVTALTLDHITKVTKDSKRSGLAKERILEKLGT
jgi:hypothetical protein